MNVFNSIRRVMKTCILLLQSVQHRSINFIKEKAQLFKVTALTALLSALLQQHCESLSMLPFAEYWLQDASRVMSCSLGIWKYYSTLQR